MQWLAALCVKRPIFASVLILILCVIGIAGYLQLGVDRFPNVDFPYVVVSTTQAGAAPEDVETEITDKVEEAVNTISGIDELRSITTEGASSVIVVVRPREGRQRRGARGPRPRQLDPGQPPEGRGPAGHPEARPRRGADHVHRAPLRGSLDPRSDRARRQAIAAHARVDRRRRRGAAHRRAQAPDQRRCSTPFACAPRG